MFLGLRTVIHPAPTWTPGDIRGALSPVASVTFALSDLEESALPRTYDLVGPERDVEFRGRKA